MNGIETESVSSIIPKSELDLIVAQINCAYGLKKAIHAHLNPLMGSEDKGKYLAMDYVPSSVGILIPAKERSGVLDNSMETEELARDCSSGW